MKQYLQKAEGHWSVEVDGDINKMWKKVAVGVTRVAKEVVSESRGSMPEDKRRR
jgi:hypothetical protein